jgi:hypothetical protein
VAARVDGYVILKMLPFFLYFGAGVITGFQVYTLLAMTTYGVPFSPLEVVALLGSLGLLIAASISLFKPRAGARVALIASLLIWSFYGPAIANLVRAKSQNRRIVSANHERGRGENPQSDSR